MTAQKLTLEITQKTISALFEEPGMSVKELAVTLDLNRQFMAGFLTALEEKGEVFHRKVGPARTYFVRNKSNRSRRIKDKKVTI